MRRFVDPSMVAVFLFGEYDEMWRGKFSRSFSPMCYELLHRSMPDGKGDCCVKHGCGVVIVAGDSLRVVQIPSIVVAAQCQ